jgi:uncharacterized membrane protein
MSPQKSSCNETLTVGQKLADQLSSIVGSWKFILTQSGFIAFWLILNICSPKKPDPYPFMFLNILLSFQAAYTGPVLLMAANRQAEIDRKRAIENLELDRLDHKNLMKLSEHIDEHFDYLHDRIDDFHLNTKTEDTEK